MMDMMYTMSLITVFLSLNHPPFSIYISLSHYFETKHFNSEISLAEKVRDARLHDLCPLTSLTDIDSLSNLCRVYIVDLITLPIVAFMDEA